MVTAAAAVLALILSGGALVVSLNANGYSKAAVEQSAEANRIAKRSADQSAEANTIARTTANVQTATSLRTISADLQRTFKDKGVNPKDLADFLYQLGQSKDILSEGFYDTQIAQWCAIAIDAKEKLKYAWDDAKFRAAYTSSAPWFLAMLDKLVNAQRAQQGGCL